MEEPVAPPSFELIGAAHNEVVNEFFEVVKHSRSKKAILNSRDEMKRVVWQTSTMRNLDGGTLSLSEYRDSESELKSYVQEKLGRTKSEMEELSPELLHAAGILSDAQFEYIEEIGSVSIMPYDSLSVESDIKVIEEQAYSELGEEAYIVMIYGATLRYSAYYWSVSGGDWTTEFGTGRSKAAATDWEAVAKADAGGAVAGAVAGAVNGVKAAGASTLMFGPGGGVLAFTGSFLGGAVGGGALASIARAVEESL